MDDRTIALPESLYAFAREQATRAGLGSADEYILGLVRQAQQAAEKARLTELILEGENCGEPIEVTDEFWDELRREFRARMDARAQRTR